MNMLRFAALILFIAVLSVSAVVIADFPGQVIIDLSQSLGFEIRSAFSFAALAVLLLALVLASAGMVIGRLWRWPTRMEEKRRYHAVDRVIDGLAALAAGDGRAVRVIARDIQPYTKPLALFFDAGAALLDGRNQDALDHYRSLAADQRGGMVGLRSQLMQSLRQGDAEAAQALLAEIAKRGDHVPWAIELRFGFAVRNRDWEEARQMLDEAGRRKMLSKAARSMKQSILVLAEISEMEPELPARVAALDQVIRRNPELWQAHGELAAVLIKMGDHARARRVLEAQWRRQPRRELIALWYGAHSLPHPRQDAGRAFTELRNLAAHNPDHIESLFSLTEMALLAQEPAEARAGLGKIDESYHNSERYCRFMADLETQSGNYAAAEDWRGQQKQAIPEGPGWFCHACHMYDKQWRALCANCDAFDSLVETVALTSMTELVGLYQQA